MHEVSIAQSILDMAVAECLDKGFGKINSISVRVGKRSGVNVESLLFAFDLVKLDTIARKASLVCEEVPPRGLCKDCGNPFTATVEPIHACPGCGSPAFEIRGGMELEMVELDVD